jgi:tetratricopeptide (TPR) repeat protein
VGHRIFILLKRNGMPKIIPLLLLLTVGFTGQAQFSQTVKDSVLQWLEYPEVKYSIQLGFRTEDYVTATAKGDSLLQLSKQQLMDKRTGHYTDATLLQAIYTVQVLAQKDTNGAVGLLNEAGQLYEQWINAEPKNVRPVDELAQLCISAGNYALVPGVLDYGLGQFPDHLPLLYRAVYFHLNIRQQFDRVQELIDKILAQQPNDLTGLQHLVSLASYRNLQVMQQGHSPEAPHLPQLQTALQRQPNEVGLRHLDWFRRVFHIYFTGISRASKVADADPGKLFEYYNLTQQELNELAEANNWMVQAAAKKDKNEGMLHNNMAVIACMQKQYGKAATLFEKARQLIGRDIDLEGGIMACFFNGDFEGMATGIRRKIAAEGQPVDYGALLRVYYRYLKQPTAMQPLLQQLEQGPPGVPLRNQVLATGYLHLRQTAPLQNLLPLLGDTENDWMIKLVAAIVGDQRQTAANCLQQLQQWNPSHKRAKDIKTIAGL